MHSSFDIKLRHYFLVNRVTLIIVFSELFLNTLDSSPRMNFQYNFPLWRAIQSQNNKMVLLWDFNWNQFLTPRITFNLSPAVLVFPESNTRWSLVDFILTTYILYSCNNSLNLWGKNKRNNTRYVARVLIGKQMRFFEQS